MKKLLSILLAIVMIATLSVTAFATTVTTVPGSDSADVMAKYNSEEPADVYSVDVTWGAMEFDYNAGGQIWNTESHKWEADPAAPAGWAVKDASNTITLANNSSKAVDASFAFAADYADLSGKFTYNAADLTGALNLEMPKADTPAKNYVVAFNPVGNLPGTHSSTAYAKMGTITVTLG